MSLQSLGQVARFAGVGLVNTFTYYAGYLLLRQGIPYLAAHVLAFAASALGSFFLNCRFTFRTPPTWKKLLLFPFSVAGNFLITTVGLAVVVETGALGERNGPLVVALAAIPVTYVVTRLVLTGSGMPSVPRDVARPPASG